MAAAINTDVQALIQAMTIAAIATAAAVAPTITPLEPFALLPKEGYLAPLDYTKASEVKIF
jgi:hypothetical protein